MRPEIEVKLWRASLDHVPALMARFWASLGGNERARARRLGCDTDRDHYVARHGILRDILSRYAACPPGDICFSYGEHGKPRLAGCAGAGGLPLHFNLSHCGGEALYAVAWGYEVGVDFEGIRPLSDLPRFANRFFSPGEACALGRLPRHRQPAAFFACWTRKEACVKACGAGLCLHLDEVEVGVGPEETVVELPGGHWGGAGGLHRCWMVNSIDVGGGYAAALATAGRAGVVMLEWRPGERFLTAGCAGSP